MGWPLEARRSLFPDWLWLCDESSPHRRALHIPVQILAGKFKMEFLPTVSLTKAFPVAQICPNLHKIVPSSISFFNNRIAARHLALGAFKIRFKVWDRWVGSIQDLWTCASLPEMPLEARRSLFPDWPWLCDESSPVTT